MGQKREVAGRSRGQGKEEIWGKARGGQGKLHCVKRIRFKEGQEGLVHGGVSASFHSVCEARH